MSFSEPTYSGPPADIESIKALVAAWDTATRKGDHAALLDMVTTDCVFLAPGMAPLSGRESLLPFLQAFSAFTVEPLFELREVIVAGDWAFCWAKDELTATPVQGGGSRGAAGWALSVLRRDSDQRWRFARGANTKLEVKSAAA